MTHKRSNYFKVEKKGGRKLEKAYEMAFNACVELERNMMVMIGEDKDFWYFRCWNQDTNGVLLVE